MSKSNPPKKVAVFQVGDRVKIKNYTGNVGKIVESRGAIGPGGASVYRVLVQRKPSASYIELRGDQLKPVTVTGNVGAAPPSQTHKKESKPTK